MIQKPQSCRRAVKSKIAAAIGSKTVVATRSRITVTIGSRRQLVALDLALADSALEATLNPAQSPYNYRSSLQLDPASGSRSRDPKLTVCCSHRELWGKVVDSFEGIFCKIVELCRGYNK